MNHIKFVKTHKKTLTKDYCADCKKKSYFVNFYEEWYGWSGTCLRCGRSYDDGYLVPFEFYRYARRDSIQSAKKRWRLHNDQI